MFFIYLRRSLFLGTVTRELDGFGPSWYRASCLYEQLVCDGEGSGAFEPAVLYLLLFLLFGLGMTS